MHERVATETNLERYKKLVDSTENLTFRESAMILLNLAGTNSKTSLSGLYYSARILGHGFVTPELFLFKLDEAIGSKELNNVFGWKYIDLTQAAKVLVSLTSISNNPDYIETLIKFKYEDFRKKFINTYPSISDLFKPFDEVVGQITRIAVPSRFFLDEISSLLPSSAQEKIKDMEIYPTEYSALLLVSRGLSNKFIARALSIRHQTAKNLVQSVLQKTGAQNRTQILLHSLQTHLLPEEFFLMTDRNSADKSNGL